MCCLCVFLEFFNIFEIHASAAFVLDEMTLFFIIHGDINFLVTDIAKLDCLSHDASLTLIESYGQVVWVSSLLLGSHLGFYLSK